MAWAIIEYNPNDLSARPFRDDGGCQKSLTSELQEILDKLVAEKIIRSGQVIAIQNDDDIEELQRQINIRNQKKEGGDC